CFDCLDDDPAAAVAQDADLGPRQGAVWACAVHCGDGHEGVLRRSPLAVAEAHEREHERAATSVLPEGYRSLTLDCAGPRSGRAGSQQSSPEGPRLEVSS